MRDEDLDNLRRGLNNLKRDLIGKALDESCLLGSQSRDAEIADLKAKLEAAIRVICDFSQHVYPLTPKQAMATIEEAMDLIEEEMKK